MEFDIMKKDNELVMIWMFELDLCFMFWIFVDGSSVEKNGLISVLIVGELLLNGIKFYIDFINLEVLVIG